MKRLEEVTIFTETEKVLLKRCRDAIYRIVPDVEVILYGSRARGDCGIESDYDLLVLTEKDCDLKQEDSFRRQLFPIELETGSVLTINVYGRHTWNSPQYKAMPFHQNVERDGVIL